MNPIQYFFCLARELRFLAKEVGYSTLQMYLAFSRCFFLKHADLEEFKVVQMYRYSGAELRKFLVSKQTSDLKRVLNDKASANAYRTLEDYGKDAINRRLGEYVRREWLLLQSSNDTDILAFMAKHGKCIAKPTNKSQGEGIQVLTAASPELNQFLTEHKNEKYILEEFIAQHPDMAALNPTSVNTIRIMTARKGEHVHIIGAALRCGGANAVVDNFHHGGIAFPLDVSTGIVRATGKDMADLHTPQFRSPATGQIVVGFQVPYWDQVIQTVTKASHIFNEIGYIAWDIAITPTGVDIVEVNLSHPGTSIVQLDGIGVYPDLQRFIAS